MEPGAQKVISSQVATCPRCEVRLTVEHSPGQLFVYCQTCGFRRQVTNIELMSLVAQDHPLHVFRLIVGEDAMRELVGVFGGQEIPIPSDF